MDVRILFDRAAQTYDEARPRLVPCFGDFYGMVLDVLAFERPAPARVLDLGAGTGLLSALVAGAFPAAHLTLADLSDAMLAHSRARFAAQPQRIETLVMDFARDPLPGEYDAVVSALAIHHLPDEAKRALYAKVYASLRPSGIFINADQVAGRTPEIDRQYDAAWLLQVRRKGASESEIAGALERMQADRYAPLDAQLAWLADAGFGMVNCWYQSYRFAVFSGVR
jgi:tRNA (cmo5U34)-methyltransferase